MNLYSYGKSNSRSGYVKATSEADAKRIAAQGDQPGVKVTRITFLRKAS